MGKVVQFSGNDVQIRAHFVPIMGKDVQKRWQSSKTRSFFAIPLGGDGTKYGQSRTIFGHVRAKKGALRTKFGQLRTRLGRNFGYPVKVCIVNMACSVHLVQLGAQCNTRACPSGHPHIIPHCTHKFSAGAFAGEDAVQYPSIPQYG